jgi:hypothetical protein
MDIQSSGQFSRIFIGYVRGDRAACGAKISLLKWYGMVWYGNGMVWCGLVWCGTVLLQLTPSVNSSKAYHYLLSCI